MTLLIIILALLALRYLHIARGEHRYQGVLTKSVNWIKWLQLKGLRNSNVLLLSLILPLLIILYALKIFTQYGHSYVGAVVWFIVNLALFWFTLWPVPSKQLETEGFSAEDVKQEEESVEINREGDLLTAHSSQQQSREYSKKLLIEANQNTFAIIFWFVLLGIYGAVIYRLINLLYRHQTQFEKTPEWTIFLIQLQQLIDWIPARLVAFGYVLVGDFVPSFQKWRQYAKKDLTFNDALLANTGLAAAGYDPEDFKKADQEENRTLYRLIDRTLIIWLFLIAIMVIGRLMY